MISVDDQAALPTQEAETFMTQVSHPHPDGTVIESGEGSLTMRIQRQEQAMRTAQVKSAIDKGMKQAPRITDYLNYLSQSCNVDFAQVPMTSESMRVSPREPVPRR